MEILKLKDIFSKENFYKLNSVVCTSVLSEGEKIAASDRVWIINYDDIADEFIMDFYIYSQVPYGVGALITFATKNLSELDYLELKDIDQEKFPSAYVDIPAVIDIRKLMEIADITCFYKSNYQNYTGLNPNNDKSKMIPIVSTGELKNIKTLYYNSNGEPKDQVTWYSSLSICIQVEE